MKRSVAARGFFRNVNGIFVIFLVNFMYFLVIRNKLLSSQVCIHALAMYLLSRTLLVRAECVRCPWAAGINVVAIVLGIIFPLSFFPSEVLTFLPERRQLGLQNFAWAPN